MFTAMMYLYSKGIKPSAISIIEVITDKKAKEEIENFGGLGYLEDISLMNIDRSNLKIFCDKIKQTYARKEIYDVCENAKNFMLSDESETLNPSELVGKIENQITEIANSAINEKSVLQCDTIFGDDNFTVALCGSNLTKQQIKIILNNIIKSCI